MTSESGSGRFTITSCASSDFSRMMRFSAAGPEASVTHEAAAGGAIVGVSTRGVYTRVSSFPAEKETVRLRRGGFFSSFSFSFSSSRGSVEDEAFVFSVPSSFASETERSSRTSSADAVSRGDAAGEPGIGGIGGGRFAALTSVFSSTATAPGDLGDETSPRSKMDIRLVCPLSMGEVPSECRPSPARVLFRRRCRTSISSGSSTSPWSFTSMSISDGNARRILELGNSAGSNAGLSGAAGGSAGVPVSAGPGSPTTAPRGGVLAPPGERLPDCGGVAPPERGGVAAALPSFSPPEAEAFLFLTDAPCASMSASRNISACSLRMVQSCVYAYMSASSPASTTLTSASMRKSRSTACSDRRTAPGSCAFCKTVCTRSLHLSHARWRSSRCAIIRSRPPSCTTHHTSTYPETRSSLPGNACGSRHSRTAFSAAVHSHTVSTKVLAASSANGSSRSSSKSSSKSSLLRRGQPSRTVLGSSPPNPRPWIANGTPCLYSGATSTCANPRTSARAKRFSSASRASETRRDKPRSRCNTPSSISATTHSPRPFLS